MTEKELMFLSRYPLFPTGARQLAEVFGWAAAAKIITAWPGQEFPVPKVVGGMNKAGKRRWGQLVSVVGEEVAAKIVAYCGGGPLLVPSCKEAIHQARQEELRQRYDKLITAGFSSTEATFDVGIEFGVSGKTVERIVNKPTPELRASAQGSLF